MKKLMIFMIIAAMMLAMAACGSGNKDFVTPDSGDDSQTPATEEKNDKPSSPDKITVETVTNAAETDASVFDYMDVDGGVSITAYYGDFPIVVIPDQIDGKDVVSIGDYAFINNETIRGLKVADKVQIIGDSAFMNCKELLVVVSGAAVKEFDQYCFGACEKLETVILNDGVEVLDDCFAMTNITEIEIPASVIEMEFPFVPFDESDHVTIISEAGSYVEEYVSQYAEEYHWTFQAK